MREKPWCPKGVHGLDLVTCGQCRLQGAQEQAERRHFQAPHFQGTATFRLGGNNPSSKARIRVAGEQWGGGAVQAVGRGMGISMAVVIRERGRGGGLSRQKGSNDGAIQMTQEGGRASASFFLLPHSPSLYFS